jgi:hypothetical protein
VSVESGNNAGKEGLLFKNCIQLKEAYALDKQTFKRESGKSY